jgi:hypothetical protein
MAFKHCDEIIDDETQPFVLRRFLHWARLPAVCKYPLETLEKTKRYVDPELHEWIWMKPVPVLFADYQGQRIRVVTASRFGDVGITTKLYQDQYQKRVSIEELSNFSDVRYPGHQIPAGRK